MLLCKLKVVCAVAAVLFVSAGAVGLTYLPAQAAPQKPARTAPDELDVLRLEIEALRKDLQVVRARVKALEARAKDQKTGAYQKWYDQKLYEQLLREWESRDYRRPQELEGGYYPEGGGGITPKKSDPLGEAGKALEKLRKDSGNKQALEALEKALKQLKERETKERTKPSKR